MPLIGSDNIVIPPGIYLLTIVGVDDVSMLGDLDIFSRELTITGAGINETIIDGNGIDRIFHSNNSTLTIQDLTLQNGGDFSETVLGGGVIFIGAPAHMLTLNNIRFENNRANAGGGLYISGSFGELTSASIKNSIFNNNTTVALGVTNSYGPAIYCRFCDIQVNATTISNNHFGSYALKWFTGNVELYSE